MFIRKSRIAAAVAFSILAALPAAASTTIPAGTIATDTTWTLGGSPYLVQGIVTVAGTDGPDGVTTLTIEPGVEVRMAANTQMIVGGTVVGTPGALVADGDAAGGPAAIRFTADSGTPTRGFWRGVHLRAGADASTLLRNVEILYGGGGGYAGLYVQHTSGTSIAIDNVLVREFANQGIDLLSGTLLVTNSTIQDGDGYDVRLGNTASVVASFVGCTLGSVLYQGTTTSPIAWTGNTFVDYGTLTSRIDPDDLGDFADDNTFTLVPNARTEVLSGTVTRDATWTAEIAPYAVLGLLTVAGTDGPDGITTLALEPGVEMRMAANAQMIVGGTVVGTPGALVADGDAAGGPATIRFTADSGTPTRGFWRGVHLRAGARASTLLRNAEVLYGGGSGYAGIYAQHASGTSIAIDNVLVREFANQGIDLLSGTLQVTNSTIQDGDGHDVRLGNTASVGASFDGCTLGSVFYQGTTTSPITWTGNSFVGYGTLTSRIDPDDLGDFGSGNTFSLAPNARTEVLAGTVTVDATWTARIAPYAVLGLLTVQGTDGPDGITTLTLEPGVEMRMAANAQMIVGGTVVGTPGALVADGDAAGGPAMIRFTADSATPTRGFWRGVHLRAGARASTLLRNAEIVYAGGGGYAGIYAQHASGTSIAIDNVLVREFANQGIDLVTGTLQVTNSTIQDGDGHDVRLANSASVDASFVGCTLGAVLYQGTTTSPITWTGNAFVGYGTPTSRIDPDDLGDFGSGNTFSLAGNAVTEVLGGTVTLDATWTAEIAPYVALGSLTVQGTDGADGITSLTLEPGVEMRMAANAQWLVGGTVVGTPGALIADGDAAGGPATIRFTADSATPTRGFWRGLHLRTGAHASTLLRNAEIVYAGGGGYAGIYAQHAAGTLIAIVGVTVRDSLSEGVRLLSGTLTATDSTIQDNGGHDVSLADSASVAGSFDGCNLESVHYDGTTMSTVGWTANTFDNWGARTSRLRIADLDAFTRGNTFNPIPGATLDVIAGVVAADATWGPAAGPLVFDNTVSVYGTDGTDGRTTLTLEPGVTVRVPSARQFVVGRTSLDPGELIADGAPGGIFAGTINFNSANDVASAGDWNGVQVLATGRAVLREVQVRNAAGGVYVRGTLGPSSNVTASRCNVGLDLDQATLESVLTGWSFRNGGIGVRAASTDATFREGNLIGSTYGVQNLTPATHCVDAEFNWWGVADGPSGSSPAVGCETADPNGTGSAITEGVLFGNFLDVTPEDGDGIACDDGDGFADPCTGGNTLDCDDNCCSIANLSQADDDFDGVGDACDSNPVLRVSSDPLDLADFAIVQDAVDASIQSGTRIEILPGLGPYLESVRLDRSQVYSFRGVTGGGPDPVVIDGGTGPAFRVINKVGSIPMKFRGLTLRGAQGVRSSVDTDLADVVLDAIPGIALQLDAGTHRVERVTIGPFVGTGALVAQGVSLDARRVVVRGATDTGFDSAGSLSLENVLVAEGADGIRLTGSGSLAATYVTIAANTGVGVDASAGGVVSSIDRSIVYDNALDDLVGAACGVVTWSDVGFPDCSATGNNLSVDPLLGVDHRPQPGSPCLDHGPDPATFAGLPASDLDGGVRIADFDGDGIAVNDCGAYEMVNATLVPGEVTGLVWDFDFRLLWNAEPDAVEYHVYRDLLSNLGFASFGACRDDLDTVRSDTQLDDLEEPNFGEGFFYLITAESAAADEGTLGFGTAAERSNFAPCPFPVRRSAGGCGGDGP